MPFDYTATYYKCIGSSNYFSHKFPYQLGLNQLSDNNGEQFNPKVGCESGGLYFTDIKNILYFIDYGKTLCTIKIPEDAQVVQIDDKYKCDKFIIESMGAFDVSMVKRSIELGADPTKIFEKASRSNREVLKYLLDIEKDIYDYDYVVRETSKEGRLEVIKALIAAGADVRAAGNCVLSYAAEHGHLEAVKILIAAGADVHAEDDSALRYASTEGHLEIVKVLIGAGADVHAEDDEALVMASNNGHLEIVKFLLAVGADIHAEDDEPLVMASVYGHLEVVKFLLAAGADVQANDGEALRLAAREGNLEIVKVLLAAGADVHANDDEALQVAIKNGHSDIIEILKEAMEKSGKK